MTLKHFFLPFIAVFFLVACGEMPQLVVEEAQPSPVEEASALPATAEMAAEEPTGTPLATATDTTSAEQEPAVEESTAAAPTATTAPAAPRFERYLPLAQPPGVPAGLYGLNRAADGWEWAAYSYPPGLDPFNSDYAPASDRLLIWDSGSSSGSGPANLAAGKLEIVDVTTGARQEILPANVVSAGWAPNGRDFSYILATPQTYELRWRTEDGQDRLLAVDVPHSLRVSPDGKLVAFTRESHYGLESEPGLYVVDLASGEETQVSPLDRAGYGGTGLFWKPQWTDDSAQLLLYTTQDDDRAATPHEAGFVWAAADGSFNHLLPDSAFLAPFDAPPIDEDHYRCGGSPFLLSDPLVVMPVGDCLMMSESQPENGQLAVFALRQDTGDISLANILPLPPGAQVLAWDEPGVSVLVDVDGTISSVPVLTSTTSEQPAPAHCPQPGEGAYLLVDAARGYCFLYPSAYDVFVGSDGNLTFYQRSLLNTEAPLATVAVEAGGARSLADVTEQRLQDYAFPDTAAQEGTLGGQAAVMLDNLPGQDANRRLFAVHEGLIYDLMVARIGADYGDVGEAAETLYGVISGSWQFIPLQPEAALIAGPECPSPQPGARLLRDEAAGYCLLIPESYEVEQGTAAENGAVQTTVYQGSLLDVAHARLFIKVEDAQGQTLQEVTDARIAEIEEAIPGLEVNWSFGHMLDGVPGNQLDQVPGQDLGRQLLLVRDGRLYTLTFTPDDADAGEAYSEMEALYTLTVDSFSFLDQ